METVRKPRVDNTKQVLSVGMSRQGTARQTWPFFFCINLKERKIK